MSTDSNEKTDRTKKSAGRQPLNARTSIPQREQQSFTSHRQGQAQHERQNSQPDFFTASANTSYIPTPSPTKATGSRTGFNGKPRQAFAHGRSLSGAYKASETRPRRDPTLPTASSLNRSGPRSRTTPTPPPGVPLKPNRPTSSTPTRRSAAANREPVIPSTSRVRNKPAEQETNLETSTQTPTRSPHQNPQETLKSPTSSTSSTPRELTDAYQRIEDEELLAGLEGEENDDVFSDYEEQLGQILEDDRPRPRSRPQSIRTGSPVSRRSSRPGSALRSDDTVAPPPRTTSRQDSMQSSDGPSSPSFLHNSDDDTFNKVRAQYENDERRLQEVLGSDKQAFSQLRKNGRAGLTLENLRRKDAGSPSKSSPLESLESASEGGFSDPALNVPKDWGSKSRGDRRWLRRFDREIGNAPDDTSKSLHATGAASEQGSRGGPPVIRDWLKSASETALPLIESPTKLDHSPRKAPTLTPTQSRGMSQSSLGRIREADLDGDEFTAHSLQASDSPPVRTSTLNILRNREIENLERKTLTTHRLGELREKKSIDHIRRRSPSISSMHNEVIQEEDSTEGKEMPARPRSSTSLHCPLSSLGDYSSVPGESSKTNDHGDKTRAVNDLTDSAVMVSSVEDNKLAKSLSNGDESRGHASRSLQRPSHERQDSIDLLRNLARVTSASPSPRLHSKGQGGTENSKNIGEGAKVSGETTEAGKPRSQSPSKIPTRGLSFPYGKLEAKSETDVQSTPLPPKSLAETKTPRVTGAWMDTPAPKANGTASSTTSPTRRDFATEAALVNLGARDVLHERSANGTLSPPLPSLEATAPKLPESALSAILAEQKAKPKTKSARRSAEVDRLPSSPKLDDSDAEAQGEITLNLGEDTIRSLEALVAPDTDVDQVLRPPSPRKTGSPRKASSPQKRRSSSSSPQKRAAPLSVRVPQPPTPSDEKAKPVQKALETKPKPEPKDEDSPTTRSLLPFASLTSRLAHLQSSLRDANKNLGSLSSAVSLRPDASSLLEDEVDENGECVEVGGQFHDFVWPCERCGCRGGEVVAYDENARWSWRPVVLPVPVLWRWRDGGVAPRLTGMGWWVLAAGGLVAGEVVACKYYIPPFSFRPGHRYGDAYGIDYSLPRPPFLFPKLVYRALPEPAKRIIYPLLVQFPSYLLSMILRFFALLFGFDAGTIGPEGNEMKGRSYLVESEDWRSSERMEDDAVWL